MDSEPIDVTPEKPKRELSDEIGGVPVEPSYSGPVDIGDYPQKRKRRARSRRGWGCWALAGCLLPCCICCALPLCAISAAAGAIDSVMESVSKTQTEVVTVPEGEVIELNVESVFGDITIEPGPVDSIVVRSKKTAYGLTTGAARHALDHIDVNITQPDDTTVNIEVDQNSSGNSPFSSISSVNLTISVPENVHLALTTTVGNVDISGVSVSSLDVTTTLGEIRYEGDLPANKDAVLSLRSTTGGVVVRLPEDVYVEVDASSEVGSITIASGFDDINREESRGDGPNSLWRGTLGQGSEDAPTLTLRTDLGEIRVEPQ